MATTRQNDNFTQDLLRSDPLDTAIEWIKTNLVPGDVFGEEDLRGWALNNGFKEEE